MENLCTPWGLPPPAYGFGHHQTRNRYASSLEVRETCPTTTQQNLLPRRQRSPSLPPILGQNVQEVKTVQKYRYEDVEGETSGYASDTVPQSSPEYWKKKDESSLQAPISAWNHNRNQEEEQRARWGDRGIAAGRFWEPHDPDARLPQVTSKGTPTWVERSLNMIDNGDTQILVIDQHSNHSSGGDTSEYKSMSEHHEKNTYLLGQNVPLEPNIKAEREYKRQKALELQAAIVLQLEDRQKQKREERERTIREEREEEERFKRQQELERKRLEEERRIVDEKQKREQKRSEALRVALERAEQQAKMEKENKKNRKLRERFDSLSLQSDHESHYERSSNRSPKADEPKIIQNLIVEQTSSPRRMVLEPTYYQGTSEFNAVTSIPPSARFSDNGDFHLKEIPGKKIDAPHPNASESLNAILHAQSMNMLPDAPLSLVQIPLSQEVFNPMNFSNGGGVQMALLVPQASLYPCMHQPISMHALFSLDSQQKVNFPSQTDTDEVRGSKVLTPSKYRNPNHRDASTQTYIDNINDDRSTDEKVKRKSKFNDNELERITSEEKLNSLKKEKRSTPEERMKDFQLENRPKWGVNKPPTQYKKQSEKDIFYTQKRKLRQRKRMQEKNYTSHSSDDNRSPSPSKNSSGKTRVSLSDYYWRKKGVSPEVGIYKGNVTVETTQILPLECDSSGVVHVGEHFHKQKRVYTEKKPRGLTLTQKFMNDKHGNPKLWEDNAQVDNKSKYDEDRLDNRKKYMDNLNNAKREQSNHYNGEETINR